MQFPKSHHADGWHHRIPLQRAHPHMPLAAHDAAADISPPRTRQGLHVLAVVVAIGALLASAGLNMADDPRPLDVQLSTTMQKAGVALQGWQDRLSRGLQVSLRAVADGRDAAPKAPAAASVFAQAETEALPPSDGDEPVRADLAPRQLQPTR